MNTYEVKWQERGPDESVEYFTAVIHASCAVDALSQLTSQRAVLPQSEPIVRRISQIEAEDARRHAEATGAKNAPQFQAGLLSGIERFFAEDFDTQFLKAMRIKP